MSKTMYELYQEHPEKHLSKPLLEEMFSFLVEDDLKPYVKDFHISDDLSFPLATYNLNSNIVTLYRKTLEQEDYLKDFPKSLQAIQAMEHELEHARSLKALEEGSNSLKYLTSLYGYKDFAIEKKIAPPKRIEEMDLKYLTWQIKDNKKYSPTERVAEIAGWKYIVNLIKNQRTTSDLLTARKMLYYSYINGYEDNRYYLEAPTLRFLLNTRMLQDYYLLKKRIAEHDYSFDTRLQYGLPITQKEYDKKILKKVRLQKRTN